LYIGAPATQNASWISSGVGEGKNKGGIKCTFLFPGKISTLNYNIFLDRVAQLQRKGEQGTISSPTFISLIPTLSRFPPSSQGSNSQVKRSGSPQSGQLTVWRKMCRFIATAWGGLQLQTV